MSDAPTAVTLPHDWRPRPYQQRLWEYLAAGGLRSVARWHRRAGKDDIFLHHTACAAHERVGNYWYCLPEYAQARKAMWDAVDPHKARKRIDIAFPQELRRTTKDQEMQIVFHNGSTFQLVGSDNPDSLVGSPPVGIVFSEYAISNPSAWGYLRPILLENGGWAAFNSTPRGKNHFKTMCELAEKGMILRADGSVDPGGWFYSVATADDTGVFTPAQLAEELHEMQENYGEDFGRALWLQEYYVSFDAAIPGAYFADQIVKARAAGRIGVVPWEESVPVHTGWDLGRTDDTVIWWFQVFGGELRVIDFHSSNGKDVPYYAELLDRKRRERGFTMGTNYLPHDARPRTLASPRSVLQQFQECNKAVSGKLGKFVIAPRLDKQEQIQSARASLSRAWIDEVRCNDGIEALAQYHREWDEEKRVFTDTPVHDWSSHPADGFMTVAVCWKAAREQRAEDGATLPSQEQLLRGSLPAQSFGSLVKRHLRQARERRGTST